MSDCLFCKIGEGSVPSDKVYESDTLFAINDINPQAPTHILIIPRIHQDTLLDVEEKDHALMGSVISVANQLAKEKGIEDPFKDNYNYKIIQNIEKMLGQYQLLDQPLLIKEEDWLHKDDTSQLNTPVAPQTPQVNVAAAPQINQQTGLTRSEAALLSPSEQEIAKRT